MAAVAAPSDAFLRSLPKAELHAHLHGCVRRATLRELASACGGSAPAITLPDATRSLSDCFAMFGAIHAVVRTSAAVQRIVCEALADAASDGVWHAELRTTPRRLDDAGDVADDGAAIRHYVSVVVAAFEAWVRDGGGGGRCQPRLLLSINRTGST